MLWLHMARQKQKKGSGRGEYRQKCPDEQGQATSTSWPGLPPGCHTEPFSVASCCNPTFSPSRTGSPEGSSATTASEQSGEGSPPRATRALSLVRSGDRMRQLGHWTFALILSPRERAAACAPRASGSAARSWEQSPGHSRGSRRGQVSREHRGPPGKFQQVHLIWNLPAWPRVPDPKSGSLTFLIWFILVIFTLGTWLKLTSWWKRNLSHIWNPPAFSTWCHVPCVSLLP